MFRKMPFLLGLLGFASALHADAPGVLVVDASGSMWGQIQGQVKMEVARVAVREALTQWPQDRALGMVAYGHRSKTDCADIETLVPVSTLSVSRIGKSLDTLKPNGMTPIGDSLRTAAQLLPKDSDGVLILVSDGEETCRVDPCAIAREIKRANPRIRMHVVGFDVAASPARSQLTCIAEAAGGRYFSAQDAAGLVRSIGAAVATSTHGVASPATAEIDWKDPAPLASVISVPWRGPGDPLDYLAFAAPGSPEDSYVDSAFSDALSMGKAAQVRTPASPGRFELRYVSPTRQPQVLGRVLVEVASGSVHIQAPESVPAGDRLRVRARGPVGQHHWIGIAPSGAPIETVLSFARTDPSGTSDVELMMPGEPGAYEIRYVLNERESIAGSRPIAVTASVANFGSLRSSYAPNSSISLNYIGPRSEANWIGLAKRGGGVGDYLSFAYIPATGPVELFAPPDAGDYDLILVIPVDGVDQIKLRSPVLVR